MRGQVCLFVHQCHPPHSLSLPLSLSASAISLALIVWVRVTQSICYLHHSLSLHCSYTLCNAAHLLLVIWLYSSQYVLSLFLSPILSLSLFYFLCLLFPHVTSLPFLSLLYPLPLLLPDCCIPALPSDREGWVRCVSMEGARTSSIVYCACVRA